MNRRLDQFKRFMRGRKVAVIGIGVSNRPLVHYIAKLGAEITAFDMADADDAVLSATMREFESAGIRLAWSVGPGYMDRLKGFDIVFRTPRMRHDEPALLSERERGGIVTSEMEVFMELCPATLFGITGSDGKTTTTTLTHHFLEEEGHVTWLGGNIGTPLLDRIDDIEPDHMVVLELSSFQLQSLRRSPDVAVVTNISPNHLDVHKDYQEYIDAKRNIFLHQSLFGRLVLNRDNYESRSQACDARGTVAYFSRRDAGIPAGAYLQDGMILYRDGPSDEPEPYLPASEILLPGDHNVENYLAAIAATRGYVSPDSVARVARTFRGVEHRLELVRELSGVRYINSSIDTSPTRTKAALKALHDRGERVVLIMGGKDKKLDYTGLGDAILTVSRSVVLCGENAPLIERSLLTAAERRGLLAEVSVAHAATLAESVRMAQGMARTGDVVMLSPAGTSFDQYRNFEERGRAFKEIVRGLLPVEPGS